MPRRRISSASDRSNPDQTLSPRSWRRQMGSWLSLHPPGTHGCSFCNKGFKSMQAVGGHQNAHRTLRIQMKMKKMYMGIIEEEKKRDIREGKRIQHSPNCPYNTAGSSSAAAALGHGGEIDLELRLGIDSPKIYFYEFLPVLKGYADADAPKAGYDELAVTHPNQNPAAAYNQNQNMVFHQLIEMPVMRAGVNENGFVNEPGRHTYRNVFSKNALDLTLRL